MKNNKENSISIKDNYKVISLFSGCGGKDLGVVGGFTFLGNRYKRNKFEIVFANDIDKQACDTYNQNFYHEAFSKNIKDIEDNEFPPADIVIGGFPCQDFSLAGNRKGFDSDRGLLYIQMKRVIDVVKPLIFVAENVEGMTNLNGSETMNKIIHDLSLSGYKVSFKVLNASNFGVPQNRKRVIIIGIRSDLIIDSNFPFPIETHGVNIKKEVVTAHEAIDDLWAELGKGTFNNHSERDYSKAKFYPGKKMQGNNRISSNKPSPTIRAEHHGNIEAHYRTFEGDENNVLNWRRLSVREVARLQTFPDNFVFPVSPSSAYRQIGNAVPPVLSWHIFNSIENFLVTHKIPSQATNFSQIQFKL